MLQIVKASIDLAIFKNRKTNDQVNWAHQVKTFDDIL